jgi:hypothetical protein
LREIVNDIEIIRFARRPGDRLPAVADVRRRAMRIFDYAP